MECPTMRILVLDPKSPHPAKWAPSENAAQLEVPDDFDGNPATIRAMLDAEIGRLEVQAARFRVDETKA
jgi:hypothetical protein